MGKVEIDHTGSGGGITLSSDGTSLLLDGTAVGGGGDPDLYRDNGSSGVTPTASGAVAVAIGNSASASGTKGLAVGSGTTSVGTGATAIGWGSSANGSNGLGLSGGDSDGDYALAIGKGSTNDQAKAQANGAVAIGASHASGVDSLAINITNNTTSYGATDVNTIAVGYQAKANAAYATSIGYNNTASGIGAAVLGATSSTSSGFRSLVVGGLSNTASGSYASVLGGQSNTASEAHAIAMGDGSTASHANSVSIGDSVQSTATNQINLGGTADTVRISETYTLPTSDGTANQVLTTNGSGVVNFADAGGGADLYAANESSPSAQPSATGANAVAIGEAATASGVDAFAIGTDTDATGTSSLAIGKSAQGTGTNATAIGNALASGTNSFAANCNNNTSSYGASGTGCIAIGAVAKAAGNSNNIAIGSNATVTAYDYGIAIGDVDVTGRYGIGMGRYSNVGGERAVNINGGQNSTSNYSVSIGFSSSGNQRSQTTGVGALSLMGSNATGQNSFAAMIGSTNNNNSHGAFAQNAIAIGDSARASQLNSVALGASATSEQIGKFAYSNGKFAADGDAQGGQFILRADTTDATATVLTTNNSTAGSTNQIVAASDTCIMFSGTLVAMQNGAQDQGGWEIKGLLKNDGGTTTLVSSNIQTFDDGNGWVVALTADNTNNALAITCTGEAAHNIRWVANIQTSEVTYA